MKTHRVFSFALWGLAAVIAGGGAGCSRQGGAGGPPPGMSIPVVAVIAQAERLDEEISAVGTLAGDEFIEIKSELDAQVMEIGFTEGERVEQGRLLFSLDDGKLSAALARAEADFKWAETNLSRTRALRQNETISQQELDQAEATYQADRAALDLARRNLDEATIKAPFTGRMGARLVSPGQYVSRGMILTTLVSPDPLKAEFSIPERYVSLVRSGQPVQIRTVAFPGESFRGEVYFVGPRLNEGTRTLPVKAIVPNANERLKPGMFADISLVVGSRESAVVIPETALVFGRDSVSVYVVQDNGTVQVRPVSLGVRLPGRVEIAQGLAAGEQVVTEGTQKLGPGTPVQVSPAEAPAAGRQVTAR